MAIVSVLTFLTFREKVDIIDIQMLCKIIATFPKKNTENMSKNVMEMLVARIYIKEPLVLIHFMSVIADLNTVINQPQA